MLVIKSSCSINGICSSECPYVTQSLDYLVKAIPNIQCCAFLVLNQSMPLAVKLFFPQRERERGQWAVYYTSP